MHWRRAMVRALFLFFAGVIFFSGCSGIKGPMPQTENCSEKLYAVSWSLKMIDNDEIALKNRPYIRFDKSGRMGGFGGCNSFFGDVSVTETAMEFFDLGSTRKYCSGMEGEVERRFFSTLKGTKWWQFDEEGDLVIFDDEHRVVLSRSGK